MNTTEMLLMVFFVLPIGLLCAAFFICAQWITYSEAHAASPANGPGEDAE